MLDKEREHKSKLPGVKLPDTMKFTTDLKEAVEGNAKPLLEYRTDAVKKAQ